MSTPSPRDPILTPSKLRQLKAFWAPIWPRNRAMMREAFTNPTIADAWNAFVEVYEPQQRPPIKVLRAPLDALLACLADHPRDVVSVYRERLPLFLCAAAQYAHTGVIPPWKPRKVAQPTPEMRIHMTPEGHTLIQAGEPSQHRRFAEKYLDIMDPTGPGRRRGRGPTLEEMLTAARQLKRNGHPVTQPRLIEQMGLDADSSRVREWLRDKGVTWKKFQTLIY